MACHLLDLVDIRSRESFVHLRGERQDLFGSGMSHALDHEPDAIAFRQPRRLDGSEHAVLEDCFDRALHAYPFDRERLNAASTRGPVFYLASGVTIVYVRPRV